MNLRSPPEIEILEFFAVFVFLLYTCRYIAHALIFQPFCPIIDRVLHTPMSFFESNPSGRIINRFSKDIDMVDNVIPVSLKSFLGTFGTLIQVLFIISFSTPIFIPILVPFAALYICIQRFYIPTSRQLKRLEAVTRSPLLTHLSESISGMQLRA